MHFDRMHTYTKAELDKIHCASMEILEGAGIYYHDEAALSCFRHHGIKVDGHKVHLKENDVLKALQGIPDHFEWHARNAGNHKVVGGNDFVFLPAYGPPFIQETDGRQRYATFLDYENTCRLIQSSAHLDTAGFLTCASADLSPDTYHLDMILASMTMTDKPLLGASLSGETATDTMAMASIVFGKEYLREHYVASFVCAVLSPLQYAPEMSALLMEAARWNQPILIMSTALRGGTVPLAEAGAMAVANAEIMGGLVLSQLVRPGVPIVYGCAASPMDMRTTAFAIGSAEANIIANIVPQMARYYGLPCRSGGSLTDSWQADYQAGMESALNLTFAVRAGANWIQHACGIVGSFNALSFEKWLADEELLAVARRIIRPPVVNDETLGVEAAIEVGPGGQFLTRPETLKYCRTELMAPELLNRHNYEQWQAEGARSLQQAAHDALRERLASYEKPDIDPAIEKDLQKYIAARKR
jgi:trimethylamine--corrinoid protein Co-methyltransferase